MNLKICQLIELPRHRDERGSLTFIENQHHIPFETKRVFYIYDVPSGTSRAGHALKTCEQFLVCISGSFEVYCDNGHQQATHLLNHPYQGLYIPPLIWRDLHDFSNNAVCLVLASELYDPKAYIDTYEEFQTLINP